MQITTNLDFFQLEIFFNGDLFLLRSHIFESARNFSSFQQPVLVFQPSFSCVEEIFFKYFKMTENEKKSSSTPDRYRFFNELSSSFSFRIWHLHFLISFSGCIKNERKESCVTFPSLKLPLGSFFCFYERRPNLKLI